MSTINEVPHVSWVKLNYKSNTLICEHCNDIHQMPAEATEITQYLAILRGFTKRHKWCKKSK